MASKYIIKNATVVSIDPKIGVKYNCDVTIEGSTIAAVGQNLEVAGHEVIDGTNAIVSPGFVDTHRHTWQTQTRTVAADHVLSDYLATLRHVYGSCYSAEDAYLGNYVGALESIDNGITYLVDHSHIMNSPAHADAAIKGLKDSKIRSVFCYGLWPNPYWEGSKVDAKLDKDTPTWRMEDAKRVREEHFKSNEPTDLLRFGFAPSEPEGGIPIEDLIKEIKHAREIGAKVITMHISLGHWARGNYVVRQLQEAGVLDDDLLLSHCSSLEDDEVAAVVDNKVAISSTPDTELQMAMGHPIAFKLKDAGGKPSIGVDVCCNIPADMFQQTRLLLQAERHKSNESRPYSKGPPMQVARTCYEALELATMGGARAVGLSDVIGSITPGKRADLIITRCDSTRLTPVHDPVAALVLYANGSDVDTVFVDGRIVKDGGKLTGVDWPTLRDKVRESAKGIMERSKKAPLAEMVRKSENMIVEDKTEKS